MRQTRRLTALASDLLDISRLDGGGALRPEALDVGEVTATVAGEFAARLGAAGRALRVDAQPARALADPAAVARIDRILLDNAINYGRGDVKVAVRREPGHVVIAVEDEGPGIPDDERDRMFERFVRGRAAAESARGAGLGLAIARGLARAMGGDLAVNGARFVLTLPAA